ncbi:MAG: nucleoside-diphosphate kinase [Candidatus Binatota bacterium]|jgi:nucleoside-diphosphate kinase|nr:nucleoside-diphosphate kinase [Candidatus Binatota bacterium]
MERTLSIVKPDAVGKGKIGEVVRLLEAGGLRVAAARLLMLAKEDARRFYAVHRERPFFESLTTFMSEGPALVMVLEGENAITRNREIMGATDPAKAAAGTIRAALGTNVERNAVHGSDSPETARSEISFFFSELEIPCRPL